jgi:hypothetical protein
MEKKRRGRIEGREEKWGEERGEKIKFGKKTGC